MKISIQNCSPSAEDRGLDNEPHHNVSLEELIRSSDFITIHVPLNENTKGLLSGDLFAILKPGAILINTSRGAVVDEKALLTALESKQLQAAGLVAPAQWKFDRTDWWLDENGLIMEKPDFPVPPGKYMVTGDREVVTVLTVHPADKDGAKRWELDNGAQLRRLHKILSAGISRGRRGVL